MVRRFASLAFAFAVLCMTPLKAADLRAETKGNVCVVQGQLDAKTKILVSIEMTHGSGPLTSEAYDQLDQDPAWRADRFKEHDSVGRVLIKVNEEPVWIPQSAFEGIILVHSIQVSRNKRGIRLVIMGGDAGVAYRADYQIVPSIRINGQFRISERVWRLGEFPDAVWERTTYHNTIWDDPDM
jgi:hypothetical protein